MGTGAAASKHKKTGKLNDGMLTRSDGNPGAARPRCTWLGSLTRTDTQDVLTHRIPYRLPRVPDLASWALIRPQGLPPSTNRHCRSGPRAARDAPAHEQPRSWGSGG